MDGVQWRTARHVEGGQGDVQHHWLPESEAREVRVVGGDVAPAIELFDAPSANAFFMRIAKESPRGRYPRAYVGEQSYWTVVGVDGDTHEALLSEDGTVEPEKGGY